MAENINSPIAPILSEEEMQRKRKQAQLQQQMKQSVVDSANDGLNKAIYDSFLTNPQQASAAKPAEPEPDALRDALVESQKQEAKSLDDYIATMEQSRQEVLNRANNQVEDTKKASIFTGAAEAASALVNLIGTTAGASNQQWQSPQGQLQSRLYEAIKQRESSIDNYNQVMGTLKQKRAALDANHTLTLAKYDKDKKTQELAARRLEIQNATAEARQMLYQLQQLKLLAAGTADAKKYEMEVAIAEQKYNNLVSEGNRIDAQTRKYKADAVKQEGENRMLGYSIWDEAGK